MEQVIVKWASPAQRTILALFEDPWGAEDFDEAVIAMHYLASSVQNDVSLIICHRVPPYPQHYDKLASIQKNQPANISQVLIVPYTWNTSTMLITTWISIVERIYPSKAKVTLIKTLQEAMKAAGESVEVLAKSSR